MMEIALSPSVAEAISRGAVVEQLRGRDAFRDDDDPADVLRAQRKARNRAPFVVLRMPSLVEEDSIEAGDDLSTRMRKKAAARSRRPSRRRRDSCGWVLFRF